MTSELVMAQQRGDTGGSGRFHEYSYGLGDDLDRGPEIVVIDENDLVDECDDACE